MQTYHKIQSIYKRDPENNFKTLIDGDYSMKEFKTLENCRWSCTEKVDGTNIRVSLHDNNLVIGGRADKANTPEFLLDRINEIFNKSIISKMTEMFSGEFIIFGEGYGAKIQKGGGNYCQGNDFVVFDILINGKYLDRSNVEDICGNLNLDIVPIIMICNLHEAVEATKINPESTWGNFTSEGFVLKPVTELLTSNGERIITKIKCKDFISGS